MDEDFESPEATQEIILVASIIAEWFEECIDSAVLRGTIDKADVKALLEDCAAQIVQDTILLRNSAT